LTAIHSPGHGRSVLVLGGGRWGRTIAATLCQLDGIGEVFLVSRRAFEECLVWKSEVEATVNGESRITVRQDLDEVPRHVSASFVATTAREHAAAASSLLRRGMHVMVEKPFVATLGEANKLLSHAADRGLVLRVNHEFVFASYIRDLRRALERCGAPPYAMAVRWHDQRGRMGWGGRKLPDVSVSPVSDIYPHVLSILFVLFGRDKAFVEKVIPRGDLDGASLSVSYKDVPVTVDLARDAAVQERSISIETRDGPIVLNFTEEPGTLVLRERALDLRSGWLASPRPLEASFRAFFDEIDAPSEAHFTHTDENADIVWGTELAESRMRSAQRDDLVGFLSRYNECFPSASEIGAMRPHLAQAAVARGLVEDHRDRDRIDWWTSLAIRVIHRMSVAPFTRQRDLATELAVTRDELTLLNDVLRSCEMAQELLLSGPHGAKYWRNTIIPLIQSGSIHTVLAREPRFPFRIGLYPGPACMLYCSFCGRNYDASYAKPSIVSGTELMKRLFKEAPKDDPHRFYISGGLEPLTNPLIGDLVRSGAQHGFRLSLYTNGYMLTEGVLKRQAGIWDLTTLRISLYGADESEYDRVTQRPKGFRRVVGNAKEFLRLRNERGSPMRLGFNYVLLPGKAEEVLRIGELLEDINRSVGSDRGVDFLTLREDYSVPPELAIPPRERAHLIEIFGRLEEKILTGDLGSLEVDYGYGLNALAKGTVSRPLEMAAASEMRAAGFPSVSVVIDLLGDVYMYREAGFIDRPGARRYCLGRVTDKVSLNDVTMQWVRRGRTVKAQPGDTRYMDIFDHVVTNLLNQAEADEAFGIPFDLGPALGRRLDLDRPVAALTVSHPTLVGR
jgi:dTDP-4-amino-4,6-dideoxy-D-glucose ammonia-lyase